MNTTVAMVFVFLFSSVSAFGASLETVIPAWANDLFRRKLAPQYDRLKDLKPLSLAGDFDGDKNEDIAVRIRHKSSGKIGIAILFEGGRVATIGAGKPVGNGGDNFNWMDRWSVKKKGKIEQGVGEDSPPPLQGDALFVEKMDSASAILFWDGEEFQWYQQGD